MHQCRLHRLTLGVAAEHLADGGAVMREIGVQPHEAPAARLVDAGNRIPGRRRRFAVGTQITLAAAFGDRVNHVDRDALRLAAAQSPDLGRGKAAGCDRGLGSGAYAKRRRQLRFRAAQRDGVERSGGTAGESPEVRKNLVGCLHAPTSVVVMPALVAGIHVLCDIRQDVDSRDKPGHDACFEKRYGGLAGCKRQAVIIRESG